MVKTLIFCLFGFLAACGGNGREEPISGLTEVRLALNWFPEVEHGGFYAALVHGYFQQLGLKVEILGGGPDAPVFQRVATAAVEFGVTNADDVLSARAREAPVVALMAPYQINPRCIMVHANSGIGRIEDIENMTLALSQRPAFSHYLRKKFPFAGVTIVPYLGNVTQFLADPDFGQQGYIFSEPFVARSKGGDPIALLVADTGFNPYGSVLIANEAIIAERQEVVSAMVQASVQGWEQYLRAPEETNHQIGRLNPEMSLEILAFGAAESVPLVLDEVALRQGLGHMSELRWKTLLQQMAEADLIPADSLGAASAFTTRFLP